MIPASPERILTPHEIAQFQSEVWAYFGVAARSMPWREDPTGYYVLVSEIMLQQTQVQRVVPKFIRFIERFPTVSELAKASLADVLVMWSGLGYNRRAKFLWQAARLVMDEYDGELPQERNLLVTLPGVGVNTAGAILAYAYNQPVAFVETNIRTVYLYHFYGDHPETVDDKTLLSLVEQALDRSAPREWYWALMDYGTHLKKTVGGRLDQSRHYKKQAPLKGSLREMRGRIIRELMHGPQVAIDLRSKVDADDRYDPALAALRQEGFVSKQDGYYSLTPAPDVR